VTSSLFSSEPIYCEILGSHSLIDEDCLLGCDHVWTGKQVPTFQRFLATQFSGPISPKVTALGLFGPEVEGMTIPDDLPLLMLSIFFLTPGRAQSVLRLDTGWTVRESKSGRGEIFCTRPERPWGPPSLLHNGYQVSFPGVKRQGRGVDHPPHLAPRLKKRQSYTSTPPLNLCGLLQCEIHLYLYFTWPMFFASTWIGVRDKDRTELFDLIHCPHNGLP
jgi:hypothetical protein